MTKALQVLNTLPATPERIPQELVLQTLLGPALSATRGNAAPEVGQTYTRARELCQQVGETPQLFPVLFGLRSFHLVQGEVQTAHELGEQLLSLAQRAHDTDLLLEAHLALGNTSFVRGEFIPTRAHFEQSLALYDPPQHRSHAFLYGLDPGVFCLGRLAMTLWFLGYPDQALETARASLTLAQKVSHPYSVVMTILHAAWTHFLRREGRAVQERGEAAKALCIEQGFPHLLGGATLCYGWALVEQGEVDDGIAQIQQGLAACRATRAKLLMSFYPTVLAEACGKAEQCEMGLSVVAEALDVVQQNGEHLSEAELYRLKGELTLQQFNVQGSKLLTPSTQAEAEAEACFLQATEVARRQSAKSLELRAVMSLSRLWQQQGKKEEAQQMLAEIYGWFTEGFDTKDLQEARALLEELSH